MSAASSLWGRNTNLEQLKSIHSRTRTHLVAECRANIAKIYEFNNLAPEGIKSEVEYLLSDDRYMCLREDREVSRRPVSNGRR